MLVSVALAAEYQPEYPAPAAPAYPATYPEKIEYVSIHCMDANSQT